MQGVQWLWKREREMWASYMSDTYLFGMKDLGGNYLLWNSHGARLMIGTKAGVFLTRSGPMLACQM